MAAHTESCYEHSKGIDHPIRAGTWVDTRAIENRVGAASMMRIILLPIEIVIGTNAILARIIDITLTFKLHRLDPEWRADPRSSSGSC